MLAPPQSAAPPARAVSIDPRDPAFVADPYASYHLVRAKTPRFYWEQYGFWCFAAHADVSELLRDRRFGRQILHVASRQELGWPEPDPKLAPFLAVEKHSLLELEPPEHTRLRALVTRAFVSRQVERLRPRIAALSHGLIDTFEARGTVDLLPDFATPIPVTVIAELLGVDTGMADQLLVWSHAMVALYQFRRTAAEEAEAVAATEAFVAWLRTVIAARRARPQDALLDHLIAAESADGRLTEDEIISTAILLLNAGHEATVHAIGNGVKSLLEAGLAGLTQDASAMPGIVEEVMRHDPPLHMFTRFALQDVELADPAGGEVIRLKRGDSIGLLLGAANRDPQRFADPDRFDPSRSPNPHMALGAGIHFCLGAPLARLELEVALPILFQRLPGLALAAPPKYRDTYHFHGLEALHLRW
jgi:cytochrome P450